MQGHKKLYCCPLGRRRWKIHLHKVWDSETTQAVGGGAAEVMRLQWWVPEIETGRNSNDLIPKDHQMRSTVNRQPLRGGGATVFGDSWGQDITSLSPNMYELAKHVKPWQLPRSMGKIHRQKLYLQLIIKTAKESGECWWWLTFDRHRELSSVTLTLFGKNTLLFQSQDVHQINGIHWTVFWYRHCKCRLWIKYFWIYCS